MKKVFAATLALIAVGAAACSNSNDDNDGDVAATTTPSTAAAPVTGTIVVSAATSLTKAFTEIEKAFETANPGSDVQLNLGASSTLAEQIVENKGVGTDVFASADESNMDKVANAGFVDESALFAENMLTIITKPENPKGIKGLADLATAGVLSLCGAEVPCGKYAAQALDGAGVVLDDSRVTRAQNAAAALGAVSDGDAVAGIVYVTDAKGNDKVGTVAIPDAQNVLARYPMAAINNSKQLRAAEAFVAFVRGAAGQRILESFGFLPA